MNAFELVLYLFQEKSFRWRIGTIAHAIKNRFYKVSQNYIEGLFRKNLNC